MGCKPKKKDDVVYIQKETQFINLLTYYLFIIVIILYLLNIECIYIYIYIAEPIYFLAKNRKKDQTE